MITTNATRTTYIWSVGQPPTLAITFPFDSTDDISVYVNGTGTDQYSISTVNNIITFLSAFAETIPDGAEILIQRSTAITQTTQYINQGKVDLPQLERNLDKLTMIAQENRNAMDEVDERTEQIAEEAASIAATSTAEAISTSMAGYVSSASGYADSASGYMTSTANISTSLQSAADMVTSQAAIAGGYASNASSYSDLASGYADAASSAGTIMSAGNGIVISGGMVSAKVDNSTVGFDSNGALSCSVSGGAQTYTAGDGISISGGVVAATSTLLQDVPQIISGGRVATGGVDSNGGYVYVWQSGATMGVSGGYRISAGDSAVTVKTNTSTGLFMNSLTVTMMNSGRPHYSATTGILNLYGSSTSTGIKMDSVCTMKNRGDNDYFAIIHAGMSATSDSVGVIQPDNSTCTVTSGGILHCDPYSAGSGIGIASGTISAKVDSSTIGFDSNGALSCSVSGGTYWAGAGITISGGVISANVDSSTVGFDTSGRLSCLVSGGSGGNITGSNGLVVSGGVVSPTSGLIFEMPTQSNVYTSGDKTIKTKLEIPGDKLKLENNLSSAATSVYMLMELNNANHFQMRCVSSGIGDINLYNRNYGKGGAKLEYKENSYIRAVGSGDYSVEMTEYAYIEQSKDKLLLVAGSGSSGTNLSETKCDIKQGGMTISAGDYALRITQSGIFAVSGNVSSAII